MTAETDRTGPEMVPLPSVLVYLKSVFELGRRSLRPALPALALLFFYRLGLGAYVALMDHSPPRGRTALVAEAASIAGPLLFLVLIYATLLPLQESLLRERPVHFLEAIRGVLQKLANLIVSGIAQVIVLLVPGVLILGLGPLIWPDTTWMWTYLAPLLYAYAAWMLVVFFFMIFATPAVVLDGEGPLHSLRTSYHLVSSNLGSALGRLLVLALLAAVAYQVATIPSSMLGAAGGTPGVAAAAAPIKIAAVIWTSAVDSLFFPFLVAAVIVLYRSLRPWTDEGRA